MCTVLQKPTGEELDRYVNPIIKEKWFDVGVLLALPRTQLQHIKKVHGEDSNSCSIMMLVEWSIGECATWGKLLSVIDRMALKPQNTVKPFPNTEVNLTLDHFRTKGTYSYCGIIHHTASYLLCSEYKV